jgi:hypothetical protein
VLDDSRKEPTALNRKPTLPSSNSSPNGVEETFLPVKATADYASTTACTNSFNAMSKHHQGTISRPISSNLHSTATEDEVLLSGEDYWGLDGSLMQDIQSLQHSQRSQHIQHNHSPQNQLQHHQQAGAHLNDDAMELSGSMSTASIGLNDWRRRAQSGGTQEIEIGEFQQLERHISSHAPQHPAPRENSPSIAMSRTLARIVGDDDDEEEDEFLARGAVYRSTAGTTNAATDASRASGQSSWGAVTQPKPMSRTTPSSATPAAVTPHSSPEDSSSKVGSADGVERGRLSNSTMRKVQQQKQVSRPAAVTPNASATSSRPAETEGRVVRPSSTLRQRGPSPAAGRRSASQPRGKAAGGAGAAAGRSGYSGQDMQVALEGKARELETELETYRNENANLKKLRKQHEAGLADLLAKKEEMLRHCEEERARTIAWCDEQKQAAEKERRIAAKQARESRQKAASGAPPIRKEKAEVEALQATIEKMKVSHEAAAKKWKLNENR